LYTLDYLDGLNGYNINIQNNKMIFYGKKFNSLILLLFEDNFLNIGNTNDETQLRIKINDKQINSKLQTMKNINLEEIKENNENESIMFFKEFEMSNNNDNLTISLLKNLFFFKSFNSMNNQDINQAKEIFHGKF